MKRIWLGLGIAAGILLLTFYSTFRLRSFARTLTDTLGTAAAAVEEGDVPAAHQAVLEGAALCEALRRGSGLYLRAETFLELEGSLRAAAGHLTQNAPEEALGEIGRAAFLAESVDWLTRRWL